MRKQVKCEMCFGSGQEHSHKTNGTYVGCLGVGCVYCESDHWATPDLCRACEGSGDAPGRPR